MPSFQISITPTKRGAGRFVSSVRRTLQKAFVEESRKRGLTQSDIAREIGVHRSVIHRELHGFKDMTVGRVAELAIAMGRKPLFDAPKRQIADGANHSPQRFESRVDSSETGNAAIAPLYERPIVFSDVT